MFPSLLRLTSKIKKSHLLAIYSPTTQYSLSTTKTMRLSNLPQLAVLLALSPQALACVNFSCNYKECSSEPRLLPLFQPNIPPPRHRNHHRHRHQHNFQRSPDRQRPPSLLHHQPPSRCTATPATTPPSIATQASWTLATRFPPAALRGRFPRAISGSRRPRWGIRIMRTILRMCMVVRGAGLGWFGRSFWGKEGRGDCIKVLRTTEG